MLVKDFLKKARAEIESDRRKGADVEAYLKEAERALKAVAKRQDALGDAATEVIEEFLGVWLEGDTRKALDYLGSRASARHVVSSMAAGTLELREETVRHRKRDEALISLAGDLGLAGARLLVRLLLAL